MGTTGPGYNNLYSWNFKISAANTTGYTTKDDEYGIYKYAQISVSGGSTCAGDPGQSVNSNTITITYSANYKFNVTVYLSTDLQCGSYAISATNVHITGGDLVNQDFSGSGESHKLYIYNQVNAPNNGISQDVEINYHVNIPVGTMSGIYTSTLNYTITLL